MQALDLTGRVALVSGGTAGIGRAISNELALAGATVVTFSRSVTPGPLTLPSNPPSEAGQIVTLQADSTRPEQVEALVEQVLEQFGRIDILVNNTGGVPYYGPVLQADLDHWDSFFSVNLRSAFVLTKAVVQSWMKANGGSIVNIASIAGLKGGSGGLGIYGITKAGLIMFTRQLARELGGSRIRVNAVAPGLIKTEFSRDLWDNPAIFKMILASNPQSRTGTVEEVARAVTFLASEAASYINGETLVIDGGGLA
jgi:NAD(P)-dependent dehydrogenase (short-subunit alcohol dehydrogenase family)